MPSARVLFWVRTILLLSAAAPAVWLGVGWLMGWLGIDPFKRLMQVSGFSALTLLLLTLAVTPLRRLSVWMARFAAVRFGRRLADWNWLIRLRRTLGLYTFFYTSLHLALYGVLDAGLDWKAIAQDLQEKVYLALGMLAWATMVPMACTSNQAAIRRLGRRWRALHRLVYLTAVLSVAHLFTQAKHGDPWPWAFGFVLAVLLGVRLAGRLRGDQGEIAPNRPAITS
jgi:methionine sulfoxide reductase heme-binding subunit